MKHIEAIHSVLFHLLLGKEALLLLLGLLGLDRSWRGVGRVHRGVHTKQARDVRLVLRNER